MSTILLLYLVVLSFARIGSEIFLLVQGSTNLPTELLVSSGLLAFFGVFLLFKSILSRTSFRDFRLYFTIDALIVLFNLFYISSKLPVSPTFIEILLIGTFVHLLFDLVFVYIAHRNIKRRYIPVSLRSDENSAEEASS